MRYEYIAMKKTNLDIKAFKLFGLDLNINLELPNGCTGALLVFKSIEAAKEYYGEDTDVLKIWIGDEADS